MTSARRKKVVPTEIPTHETANRAFAEYARLEASIRKAQAEMDIKITKIRDSYVDRLSALQAKRDEHFEVLQAFGTGNPDLFVKRKSMEFAFGIIGFRTGTPKLKTLKGFTWTAVLSIVKDKLPEYVRTKEEVDKEGIISNRDTEHVREWLRPCGMEVSQDETFYVEPKLEELESA